MKILQASPYIDPKLGGQERHVLTLSKTLTSLGHEVTILTCQPNVQHSQNFKVYHLGSRNLFGLRLIYPNELINFLLENQFDVCHLHHETFFGEIILLTNKVCKLPTVTTLHSQMIRRLPAKFFYDRVSLRLISALSSKVICLSPRLMQSLVRRGLSRSKCVVIPNAINVKSLKNRFRKIRKELPNSEEFDLLFVGRLEQRKGIKWLLQSLILLHKKGKKVTLKIVGQGPLKDELQRFISANDLRQHVNLLGYVSDEELLKLYLLTKCVVVPSLYEGIPGVALEAMAAGKPLIVSNIPGLGELVVNEANGLLVSPLDVQGLASAIDRILTDPYPMKSHNHINEKILAGFDWNIVTHKILEAYHKALDDSRNN